MVEEAKGVVGISVWREAWRKHYGQGKKLCKARKRMKTIGRTHAGGPGAMEDS